MAALLRQARPVVRTMMWIPARGFAASVGTDVVKVASDVKLQKARTWDEGVSSQFSTTPLSDLFGGKKVVIFGLPDLNKRNWSESQEIIVMAWGVFDLETQFARYGAYHNNATNIFIHTICVWPLLYTGLLLGCFTPALGLLPFSPGAFPFQEYMILNLSFFVAVAYALFYIMMDKKAGTLAAALCLLCWVSSNALAQRLGFSLAWKVVLVSQVVCWTAQFIGHGVFEKRSPALLDNLIQAFMMAPFFVLLEVLQKFCGYEPYPGFQKAVRAKMQANIKEWRLKKQKKSA